MKVLGIIPARAGSRRLPGKNLLELGGRPLWRIAYLQAVKAGTDPLISTNIDEILHEDLPAEVLDARREDLSQDDTPIERVIDDILERHTGYDAFVLLNPTHPLRHAEDIRACIEALESFPSCTGVRKDYGYTVEEGARLSTLNEQARIPRLVVTGGIYAVRVSAYLEKRKLMMTGNVPACRGTYHVEQPPYIDINSEEDYVQAAALWEHLHARV